MVITLNKKYFARNKSRQEEHGAFFKKSSLLMAYFLPLILMLFFTPAVIATSLLSKEVFMMITNILLSLGYLTNFSFKVYTREFSKTELVISLLFLAAFIATAYMLFPPLGAISFINVLSFSNQISIAINIFFLLKHTLVPPGKRLVEKLFKKMGFNNNKQDSSVSLLSLDSDRAVIDRLLLRTYHHDSFSEDFREEQLASFNRLLQMLDKYQNKYQESFFGNINNQEKIADIEKQITQLVLYGNTDSSYGFIQRKIQFKTTKIKTLETAKALLKEDRYESEKGIKTKLQFFKGLTKRGYSKDKDTVTRDGLECLDKEIQRLEKKISSLQACLPEEFPARIDREDSPRIEVL